jgi:hypothetical protein
MEDHYSAVATKQGIHQRFSKQHTIRHVEYSSSLFATDVLIPDSVADLYCT